MSNASRSSGELDANRYVVDGDHAGSILPGRHADLGRRVFLRRGARVAGGILGGSIEVSGGPVRVDRGVYATAGLTAEGDAGLIDFGSCVAARQSVMMSGGPPGAHVRVTGDICSPTISLKGCVVHGNVYGERVVLDQSVVLGTVHAQQSLRVVSALVGTFAAARVTLDGPLQVASPVGYVKEPLDFNFPVLCLTFDELERLLDEGRPAKAYAFCPADLKPVKAPTTHGGEQWYCLSIAPRLLNLESKRAVMRRNAETLRRITLRSLTHPDEPRGKVDDLDQLDQALLKRVGMAATGSVFSDFFEPDIEVEVGVAAGEDSNS